MKKPSGIELYVAAICLLAGGLLFSADWGSLLQLGTGGFWGFGALLVLGLLAEQQALTIKIGRIAGGSSVIFLPLLTIVLLFGATAALAFMICVAPISQYGFQRKEPLRANFNIGQYIASTELGALAYHAAGGAPIAGPIAPSVLHQLWPFALFGVVFVVFNNAAVAMAISIAEGMSFPKVWASWVGQSGTNIVSDILIGPIAIAVAALYLQIGQWGLWIAIFPLYFVRHSYLTTNRLQQANRDLLTALVKAIETRDPYTSGHSVRVAGLAKSIARELGLSEREADAVESAALLHDIGKIEGIYSEILRKPEALSVEERRVIESHVTKGAELLSSLTSLGDSVISPVKYHHEHFDGSGYPEGLTGSEIPLGARIIKVCDAIDAMLSDRPYRRALQIDQVYQQMELYAGIQFDPAIVDCVLSHDLIRLHEVELAKGRGTLQDQSTDTPAEGAPIRFAESA